MDTAGTNRNNGNGGARSAAGAAKAEVSMRAVAAMVCLATLVATGCERVPADARTGAYGYATPELHAYQRELGQWRAQRLAKLRAADGWLSYTGSGRLRPGSFRIGSGKGNELVLPAGPARLGTLTLDKDGGAVLEAVPGSGATVGGEPLRRVELQAGIAGEREATRVQLGAAEFYLVRTGSVLGWRFRDPAAARLREFKGIDHFPVDPAWRVVARWQPFAEPRQVTLLTSIGTPQPATVPGEAVFEVEGRSYRLQPVLEKGSDQWFFLFVDRTSGKESYGGARYLFTPPARDGKVVLDFNRAENPPCALTPHVVCPIAPPGNRLDLAVTAGEKNYFAGN